MDERDLILTIDRAPTRRRLLRAAITAACTLPFAWINRAFAARPIEAFRAETVADTVAVLFGDRPIPESDRIRISAADLAENGSVVPIKIETDFTDVTAVSIIAMKNPVPLVAKFAFSTATKGFVATRIKLASSSEVIAVVETGSGTYQARKPIEVTIGGCSV
jgi:sulfur-oxidizing protein SoxY